MPVSKFFAWVLVAFCLAMVGWVGQSWWDACAAGRVAEAWGKAAFLVSFLTMATVAALIVNGNTEIVITGDYSDFFGEDGDDEGDEDEGPNTNPSGNGHIHRVA